MRAYQGRCAVIAFLLISMPLRAKPIATAERLVPAVAPSGPVTAEIDLASEFQQMKGFSLSQRVTVVAPHTGRPMHSRAGMPEIVRILSGTLTDSRNGAPAVAYGPGSTLVNAGGLSHMWANLTNEPVIFVSTQIRAVP